jgi:hypothetical protein
MKALLAIVLVVFIVGGSVWTMTMLGWNIHVGPTTPPTTPPNPTQLPTPAPTDYVKRDLNPQITFSFRGATAGNGETVAFLLPNADKTYWKLHGTSYTVASGVVTGPPITEGQVFKVWVKYNATTVIQDQYKEYTMPYMGASWTGTTVPISTTFEIKKAPSSASATHLYLYTANNTLCSTNASAPTRISLGSASGATKANQPMRMDIVVTETWRNVGGAWSQPATDQGHLAKDFVSTVRFTWNTTTGYSWGDDNWSMMSGTSTTRNFTKVVDEIETGNTQNTPKTLQVPILIDWTGTTANTLIMISVYHDDTQVLSQVIGGTPTVRSAPNAGRLHADSATYYIYVVA